MNKMVLVFGTFVLIASGYALASESDAYFIVGMALAVNDICKYQIDIKDALHDAEFSGVSSNTVISHWTEVLKYKEKILNANRDRDLIFCKEQAYMWGLSSKWPH